MRARAWIVLLAAAAIAGWGRSLAAQEGFAGSKQRTSEQKAGLPPPYYSYANGAPTTSHVELTCEDAIRSALEHASRFTLAQSDEEIAAREVTVARAALWPAISAPFTYYGNTPSAEQPEDGPRVPSFAPSNGVNKTSAFLVAAGPLDASGALRAALERNRMLLQAAHEGSAQARRELAIATADAYYTLSQARQTRRLADETLALAETFAEITRELVAGGKSENADLLRARAEALRRRDELEQARVAETVASDALHAIAGIDPAIHLGVVRPTTDVPPLGGLAAVPAAAVVAQRPELLALEAQQRAAAADVRVARGERLPQLGYNVAAGFDATDIQEIHRFSGAAVFLGLTVPLYSFGIPRAHAEEAALRASALETQHRILERTLTQEYFSTRAAALGALDRLRLAQQRALDAEQNLYDLMARYRSNKVTITELLDAQSAHADARTALYQAVTDYEAARVRLAVDPTALSFVPEAVPPAAPNAVCADQTPPQIAGLGLGLTLEELRAGHPALAIPAPDERGVVTVESSGAELAAPAADDPAFAVVHATLKFFQGRLYSSRIVFSPATVWTTKDAFLTAAAERFHLHGPWRAFYDWRERVMEDAEDIRELASECDGYRVRLGLGYFSEGVKRVATPHVTVEDSRVLTVLRAHAASAAAETK